MSVAPSLPQQARFRAGFDFLRLRADAGEVPQELADWWEDLWLGGDDDREAMLQELRQAQGKRAAPRRVSRDAADAVDAGTLSASGARPEEGEGPEPSADSSADMSAEAQTPARKRRRRRRGGARQASGVDAGAAAEPG